MSRFSFPGTAKKLLEALSFSRFESNFSLQSGCGRTRRGEPLHIDRFADELPYAQFEEADGLCAVAAPSGAGWEGLGYVIEIEPQTGTSEIMAKNLEQLIASDLPEGSGIQVTLFGSPFIEPLADLVSRQAVRPETDDTPQTAEQKALLYAMAHERAGFLKRSASCAPNERLNMRVRNLRAWISVVIPTKNPFDPAVREEARQIRSAQTAVLSSWHFAPWVWNERSLVHTVSQILNPHLFLNECFKFSEVDTGREPRAQCVHSDTRIHVREDGIKFSSARLPKAVTAVSLSARSYPEVLALSKMIHAAGSVDGKRGSFTCPFLITTYLSKPSFEKNRASSQLKSARAEQMAATEIARFIPTLAEEARDWRAAVASFEQGEGLVQLAHQIMIFAPSPEAHRLAEAAKSVFNEIGIDFAPDDFLHLQGLMTSLPMTGGPLLAHDVRLAKRSSTKTAVNAVSTFPLLGDWKGTGPRAGARLPTPVLSLVSRRGQLLHVDPFANPNGNYNGVVIGSSGSGKSVMLNELALGILRNGGRVWVIDIGRSYEKLCRVTGGQWIELSDEVRSDGTRDCLNPFSLIRDIDEDMDLMLPLLAEMASPAAPLDDLQLSHLQIHFKYVWQKARSENRTATMTDLADSLLHNGRIGGAHPRLHDPEWESYFAELSSCEQERLNDPRLVDLGVQLLPYARGGAFSSFFEGEANINFDNAFIVLELEHLNSRKSLRSVVLLLLMYMIDLEMRKGDRAQAKLVIIDEAWDLMAEGHSAKFIEAGYRRARKLNGSFFTGTQAPGDYHKSETAKAALDNADCMFVLRLKPSTLEEVRREGQLGMNEAELSLLSSLTSEAGAYSEVMVRIGDSPPSVNRLILDPYSLLLMSSHPADVSDINRFKAQGLSTHEAIAAVLKERGLASGLT